jgi:hypothetical protein
VAWKPTPACSLLPPSLSFALGRRGGRRAVPSSSLSRVGRPRWGCSGRALSSFVLLTAGARTSAIAFLASWPSQRWTPTRVDSIPQTVGFLHEIGCPSPFYMPSWATSLSFFHPSAKTHVVLSSRPHGTLKRRRHARLPNLSSCCRRKWLPSFVLP